MKGPIHLISKEINGQRLLSLFLQGLRLIEVVMVSDHSTSTTKIKPKRLRYHVFSLNLQYA